MVRGWQGIAGSFVLANQDDASGINMQTMINLFKKTLKYPALWVSLIYLLWWLFTFTNDAFINGIIILGVYFIITILEISLLSSKNKTLKTALFVILLCLTLFSFMLAIWEVRWIYDAPLDRRHLIPLIIVLSSYKAYDLIRGSTSRDKVLLIILFILTFPVLVLNIAYPISFFPEIVTKKEFGNFKYYIVWQIDREYRSYRSFYKCEKWSLKCKRLYSESQGPNWDKILIDKKKNEVSIVRSSDNGLAYTDGGNPRRYEGFSVRLGNHVYQMAIDDHDDRKCMSTPSCNSYTYTLYECDLDYTSCDHLPVQYSEMNHEYEWGYLDVNEATSEINAYSIKDSLIFTYGENPVCYIDRCVILDQ
jgi:hypothetical protein